MPLPRHRTPRRPGSTSYGHQVAQLASAVLGVDLLPWQRDAAELATECDRDGDLLHRVVILSVGRRGAKTELCLLLMLWRALHWPQQRVRFTAQTGLDGSKLFAELAERLATSPLAGQLRIRRGAGRETVSFPNGSVLGNFPPTPSSLHGWSTDLVVIDEAWSFSPDAGRALDAAILPTQATRPNSQVIYSSAAGTLDSTWWQGKLDAATADPTGAHGAVIDYGLAENAEPTVDAVAATHPAVDRLIPRAELVRQQDALEPAEWRRAFGNAVTLTRRQAVDPALWAAAETAELIPAGTPYALGFDVDVGPQKIPTAAAIAGAATLDDGRVVTWLHRYWLTDARRELQVELRRTLDADVDDQIVGIGCDEKGPALEVAQRLRAEQASGEWAGTPLVSRWRPEQSGRHPLLIAFTAEWQSTCQSFLSGLADGSIVHQRSPYLDAAIEAVAQRPVGDGWVWSRRTSAGPISPITATTAALLALAKCRPAPVPMIY